MGFVRELGQVGAAGIGAVFFSGMIITSGAFMIYDEAKSFLTYKTRNVSRGNLKDNVSKDVSQFLIKGSPVSESFKSLPVAARDCLVDASAEARVRAIFDDRFILSDRDIKDSRAKDDKTRHDYTLSHGDFRHAVTSEVPVIADKYRQYLRINTDACSRVYNSGSSSQQAKDFSQVARYLTQSDLVPAKVDFADGKERVVDFQAYYSNTIPE